MMTSSAIQQTSLRIRLIMQRVCELVASAQTTLKEWKMAKEEKLKAKVEELKEQVSDLREEKAELTASLKTARKLISRYQSAAEKIGNACETIAEGSAKFLSGGEEEKKSRRKKDKDEKPKRQRKPKPVDEDEDEDEAPRKSRKADKGKKDKKADKGGKGKDKGAKRDKGKKKVVDLDDEYDD